MTVGNNQIKALKEFVARHDDFMEIALDLFELRDILRRNKLAIIIGSELDDIGNFAWDKSVNESDPSPEDKQQVRDEIDRLYGLGMRYIFPVHLMDNKFGGTPIVSPMLNMASKFLNGSAWTWSPRDRAKTSASGCRSSSICSRKWKSTRSKSASQRRSSRCSLLSRPSPRPGAESPGRRERWLDAAGHAGLRRRCQ